MSSLSSPLQNGIYLVKHKNTALKSPPYFKRTCGPRQFEDMECLHPCPHPSPGRSTQTRGPTAADSPDGLPGARREKNRDAALAKVSEDINLPSVANKTAA